MVLLDHGATSAQLAQAARAAQAARDVLAASSKTKPQFVGGPESTSGDSDRRYRAAHFLSTHR